MERGYSSSVTWIPRNYSDDTVLLEDHQRELTNKQQSTA